MQPVFKEISLPKRLNRITEMAREPQGVFLPLSPVLLGIKLTFLLFLLFSALTLKYRYLHFC